MTFRRFFLLTIALLGLIAVLLIPQTGWLARRQLKMAWLNQGEAEIKRLFTPPKPVAATPAMEAAWKLNVLSTKRLRWTRPDLQRLVVQYSLKDISLDTLASKEALQLCAVGEKSDPDNAFFPLIRSSLLLGLRKDNAALEALHQAAGKPFLNTYEEAANRSVYQQLEVQGIQGLTGYVFPLEEVRGAQKMWIVEMRPLFQGIMAHALRRQVAGDLKGAMAIRYDLRRLHDVLIRDENYLILKITDIAQLSPLPVPIVVTHPSGSGLGGYGGPASRERTQMPAWMGPILPYKQRSERYITFLREQGYTSEALAYERSVALSDAKEKERQVLWDRDEDVPQSHMYRLSLWAWIGCSC